MKKLVLSALVIGFILMLSGCYFFVPLEATVTLENKTDKTFAYIVSYNLKELPEDDVFYIEPNETKTHTIKGRLTEASFNDSTESFYCYYVEKEVLEEMAASSSNPKNWILLYDSHCGSYVNALDKRSLNYKVVFETDSRSPNNYTITVTW